MLVYLDTAPVIYLVENIAPWERSVTAFLKRTGVEARASVLTRMECRVGPLRAGDVALIADYEVFFASFGSSLLELHAGIFEKATELRAHLNIKTPDALHLAAAIWNRCDMFLANDRNLKRCAEIQVEVLEL